MEKHKIGINSHKANVFVPQLRKVHKNTTDNFDTIFENAAIFWYLILLRLKFRLKET